MAKQEIAMRIICLDPIRVCLGYDALEFGLQDKKQNLQSGTALSADELSFDFALAVQRRDDGGANFTGAYAQGPRDKRFVYLTYKGLQGEIWSIFRRIKVPLYGISWGQVEAAHSAGQVLQARVSGLRSGTAPLLDGVWLALD